MKRQGLRGLLAFYGKRGATLVHSHGVCPARAATTLHAHMPPRDHARRACSLLMWAFASRSLAELLDQEAAARQCVA